MPKLIDEKNNEPLTWGLALLGHDFAIFIFGNMAAVARAGRFSICLLLLSSTSVFQLGFNIAISMHMIAED